MANDSADGSYDNKSFVRPPSYNQLFTKEHDQSIGQSMTHSNSAVVLKVAKLDDSGRPSDIQWKYDEEKQVPGDHDHKSHGFGILITSLFIIGEMVGGGIISMPNALYRQGWGGIAVIVIISIMSGFTGVQLGRCWTILQQRWPALYLKHTQKPYPEIGYQVGGVWCRRLVSMCVNLTLIGTATVFLVIVGQNVTRLVTSWAPNSNISFCYYILIGAAVLLPFTYLGSPADFWPASIGAAASTTIAVIIMIIGMVMQYKDEESKGTRKDIHYPKLSFVDFIMGYGTIMFAYSGQCAFPTIQHDMKEPSKFPKAIVGSYGLIFFYYLPVSILGYFVFGHHLGDEGVENVLVLLPKGWIQDTVTVLITLHVMFGFIIFLNPFNQELESLFGIPPKFSIKRLILRTITMFFILFLAESIPSMYVLLNLVGGTALAFLAFVFPGWFYLKLRWRTTSHVSDADHPVRKWEIPATAVIVLVGVLGAIASVYAFIFTVITGGNGLFRVPCYIDNRNNITVVE